MICVVNYLSQRRQVLCKTAHNAPRKAARFSDFIPARKEASDEVHSRRLPDRRLQGDGLSRIARRLWAGEKRLTVGASPAVDITGILQ